MVPGFPTSRLLRESAPVAVIMLFWIGLATLLPEFVATSVRDAGVVMALLYVVVRGVALSESLPTVPAPETTADVVRENVAVALGAGAWFLGALLVGAAEGLWDLLGLPGLFFAPVPELAAVFGTTGVATVVLYAVAIGLPRVRLATGRGASRGGRGRDDVAPADD